ncbi:MAG: glycerophosphodiester phosphodiesterase family protein [Mesorhizobium sp.]|uniref:glycerophosphodiester phosphodiesterase family protein n=1 Tax=Mesorhizobium sp. TaxID=1871066 RepID=UPI0011FFF510|nr:glycerophosphodiester phosphodiesterase family protein [Mesorhizobium sp.]TIQ71677.1 MAG: glycerophosphodiester phosphodiesterase family protein [Mesorhizobium sp.]
MNYRDYISNPSRPCAVVVHRGFWEGAPENSLLAIARAIAAGHDIVEIDVRRTVDGEFVLLHDDTLERMAGSKKRPESMTLKEVTKLRLRDRDGGEANVLTRERVPSLNEVFELTRDRIFIHLDVKHREVIPEVLTLAQAIGVDQQVDFWADLQTPRDLAWIREVVGPHGVLFMPKTHLNAADAATQLDLVFDLAPAVCELVYDTLGDITAVSDRFAAAGIALWCNTLDGVACGGFTDTAARDNPDDIWGRLIDAGVSVIQTDHADLLRAFATDRAGGSLMAAS